MLVNIVSICMRILFSIRCGRAPSLNTSVVELVLQRTLRNSEKKPDIVHGRAEVSVVNLIRICALISCCL